MRISDWSSDVCSSDLLVLQAAVGVQQLAMGLRVEQAALVELALDLDQQVGKLAQQRRRGGLVVHVGAAAAILREHAAQQQQVLGLDALLGEPGAGRMVETGRASWREGGVSVRVDLGGGGFIQK